MPQLIRAFREAYPHVLARLEDGRGREHIAHLQSERIDVAFVRMHPANLEGFATDVLLEEPMVVALPAAHALARRNRGAAIHLKALANETFIAYANEHALGLLASTFAAIRAAGFSPHVGQQVPGMTSALSFVAGGLGIAIVPASLQRLRIDGVAYRRLEGTPRLTAPLTLVSRRGDPSVVVRHFLALARKAAKKFTGE